LFHGAFGFAGAYGRFVHDRDMSGITAQLIMLAAAIAAFTPLLEQGQFMGQRLSGAVAPVGVGMIVGAFVFGVGMRLAGGCASGTLFAVGGGSGRMVIVLVFFCVGAFIGSLHFGWWATLPRLPVISMTREWGWYIALPLQLSVLVLVYVFLRCMGGWNDWTRARGLGWKAVLCGPWPLVVAGLVLAGLNVMTLVVAGHPWSVTWGYTLWGAKAAVAFGWEPAESSFWRGAYSNAALTRSILHDSVSVMNFGIIGGAALAAALAGKLTLRLRFTAPEAASAIVGGLLLGYGARLAYGCNIGAFFSGVASSSLHGWVWIIAAAFGFYLATARPWSR